MSDYIHQELLFRILKKIPVKTLLQWRCVCKSWKQLIDSPDFILDHLAVQTQKSRLIVPQRLGYGELECYLLDSSKLPLYDTFRGPDEVKSDNCWESPLICASLHGVICLVHQGSFLLWNPSIRQSIKIRFPTNHRSTNPRYGFWIDPCTNHFKIVMINVLYYKIFLYTSGKDEWTEMAIVEDLGDLSCEYPMEEAYSVMIDGVTHWIATVEEDLQRHVILFFDFGQEKIGTIELPELPRKPPLCAKFVCKWDGLLSFVEWDDKAHICDLWVLQNGGSWSKISSFSLTDNIVHVHHVWPDCGSVLADTEDGVVLYDPKSGCISLDLVLRITRRLLPAVEFVESFVFPHPKCVRSGSSKS